MTTQNAARITVINVLKTEGITKLKPFTIDSHNFSPLYLMSMAWEIENNYMFVEYDSSLNGAAEYNSVNETLKVGFSWAHTVSRQAIIVHETTHAMFDFKGRPMDIATSEAFAYIAQCQYALVCGIPLEGSLTSKQLAKEAEKGLNSNKVFEIGVKIARNLLGGATLSSSEVAEIRSAISVHRFYSNCHAQTANYDGYL